MLIHIGDLSEVDALQVKLEVLLTVAIGLGAVSVVVHC